MRTRTTTASRLAKIQTGARETKRFPGRFIGFLQLEATMGVKDINKMRKDVASYYHHPREILADDDLERDQMVTLLQDWELDLRQLMIASEENMAPAGIDRSGTLLAAVHKSLDALGAKPLEDAPQGATKLGG
jgi:hypothetical protein